MKFNLILIFSTILSVSSFSCKKEGCTNCNATNFNEKADIDDNSCQFVNDDLIGTYAVKDSITGPPAMEWYHRSYDLEISKSQCSPYNLTFSNYAKQNSNTAVVCQVHNNSIAINKQNVNGISVRRSSGYFKNDSIYFQILFENDYGEVFYGKCFGKKK